MTEDAAIQLSFERLIAASPVMGRIAPLKTFQPDLAAKTLFHAGPPFENVAAAPTPIKNSAAAAAVFEGWHESIDHARAGIEAGEIALQSAQDNGIVTPLAFVAGPSTYCLEVRDENAPERNILSPLNDGPPPHGLRFGRGDEDGLALLRTLAAEVGPDLAQHVNVGVPILPLLATSLAAGDDLHGHLAALQSRVFDIFGTSISPTSRDFIEAASQFVLNVVMASAALMIDSGRDVPNSRMVIACGGNGVELGYKLSGAPEAWQKLPANRPIGPQFPALAAAQPLPAIGDSAVIDALGLGAACLRFCPTLKDALDGHINPVFFNKAAHAAYIGPHPALPLPGLRVGLGLERPRECLGIMLGMVEETGTHGLIGRGVATWP
jgi:hypothetical protein